MRVNCKSLAASSLAIWTLGLGWHEGVENVDASQAEDGSAGLVVADAHIFPQSSPPSWCVPGSTSFSIWTQLHLHGRIDENHAYHVPCFTVVQKIHACITSMITVQAWFWVLLHTMETPWPSLIGLNLNLGGEGLLSAGIWLLICTGCSNTPSTAIQLKAS